MTQNLHFWGEVSGEVEWSGKECCISQCVATTMVPSEPQSVMAVPGELTRNKWLRFVSNYTCARLSLWLGASSTDISLLVSTTQISCLSFTAKWLPFLNKTPSLLPISIHRRATASLLITISIKWYTNFV